MGKIMETTNPCSRPGVLLLTHPSAFLELKSSWRRNALDGLWEIFVNLKVEWSCWRYEIGCFQYIYTRYIKNRIIRTDLGTSLIYQAQICLDPLLTNELMFIQMQTHPMPVITVPPKKIRTCLLTPHVSWEGKPYFHLQVNLRYFIRSEFLISWC